MSENLQDSPGDKGKKVDLLSVTRKKEFDDFVFSGPGRVTEAEKQRIMKFVDPEGYKKVKRESERRNTPPIKEPWKKQRDDPDEPIDDDFMNPVTPIIKTLPSSPCFKSIKRENKSCIGEISRVKLGRSFTEFNEEHDPPPLGRYNPLFGLLLPKDIEADFRVVPEHHSIKAKEILPEKRMATHPPFDSEIASPGTLLALGLGKPDLSLASHRERHLKAKTDNEHSFTGWTPCNQEITEMSFPSYDFNYHEKTRFSEPGESFFIPGKYADSNGYLHDCTKPEIKQGLRFVYDTNKPMKMAQTFIPDRSLSRFVPMLNKSHGAALWRRSSADRYPDTSAKTVYKEEDAEEVLRRQMTFTRTKGEQYLKRGPATSPRFEITANRRTQSMGARIFQGDHAMRGAHGLKREVSLEFQQLPVEVTAESWGVRAKISCPRFQTGLGREKTKRWSKTPQLRRTIGALCPGPVYKRQTRSKCGLSGLASDAEQLRQMRRTRSYLECPEWGNALEALDLAEKDYA